MKSFSRAVHLNEKLFRVSFNEIYVSAGNKYFATITGKDGGLYSFEMKEIDGKWRIVNAPKLPGFITNNEEKFSCIIREFSKSWLL